MGCVNNKPQKQITTRQMPEPSRLPAAPMDVNQQYVPITNDITFTDANYQYQSQLVGANNNSNTEGSSVDRKKALLEMYKIDK